MATLNLLVSTHHAHGLRGGFNPISQGGNTKVVVSCVLHNTKVQKLQLTYSQPVNETSFSEEVEVATPTLYEEDKPVGTFSKIGYGEWELNYTPQRGKAYRLVVEVPGHPTITATTTMPIPVGIYHGKPRNRKSH